jgi:uncharacterized short protein YbdD (DUF466 family)
VKTAGVVARLLGAAGAVRWYLREVSGESAYDRYCAHQRRVRPAAAPPSRREFQRMRARHQERDAPSRCC